MVEKIEEIIWQRGKQIIKRAVTEKQFAVLEKIEKETREIAEEYKKLEKKAKTRKDYEKLGSLERKLINSQGNLCRWIENILLTKYKVQQEIKDATGVYFGELGWLVGADARGGIDEELKERLEKKIKEVK
jgi:hypothetical protein